MGDVETGHGYIYHCVDKPSEFLKVVIYGKHLEDDDNKSSKVQSFDTMENGKKSKGKKKAPKPPRHPRGPSLDEADRRFIEEMVLKRVKTERLKKLKRLDDTCAAPSRSKGSLSYMLVIIILGLLIFIHIMKLGA